MYGCIRIHEVNENNTYASCAWFGDTCVKINGLIFTLIHSLLVLTMGINWILNINNIIFQFVNSFFEFNIENK